MVGSFSSPCVLPPPFLPSFPPPHHLLPMYPLYQNSISFTLPLTPFPFSTSIGTTLSHPLPSPTFLSFFPHHPLYSSSRTGLLHLCSSLTFQPSLTPLTTPHSLLYSQECKWRRVLMWLVMGRRVTLEADLCVGNKWRDRGREIGREG